MTTECCGNGVMTPVIWLVAWLLQAHSAMCDLPAPVNVTLSSSHFVHLLKWDPGPESPGGVYYLVKVCSDGMVGQPWEVVAGCEHVEFPLECNLTKAFSSRNHIYYNQVFTVLGNQVSLPAYQKGFKPITDTHLDPPVVSVRACGSTLCVGLRPPVDGLRDLYDRFHYKFNISSSTRLGATYCVSVSILDNQEIRTKSSSYSQPHCAFTAAKYTADTQTTAETESNRPHVPVFITSDQQPTSLHRPDRLSMSLSNNHPLSKPSQTSQLPESARCASRGQDLSFSLSSERDTGNVEGLHPGEEEEEEGSCLDVNLLSVTLGRHEEMKRQREMMEPEHLSLGEPPEPTTPFLPSDTKCWAPEPVTTQTQTATSEVEEEEEEEEEEDSGYMRR
ncbi:unnamed protein product, partial [Coregonus sp. 'balchen']